MGKNSMQDYKYRDEIEFIIIINPALLAQNHHCDAARHCVTLHRGDVQLCKIIAIAVKV